MESGPQPPTDLAAPPPPGTRVPSMIAELAGDAPVTLLWQNEPGGIAARIDLAGGAVVAKWNPPGSGESLADERDRMAWLQGRFPAPEVVSLVADHRGELLVTRRIDAASAVSHAAVADGRRTARAIGEGLRRLHALPVEGCPFDWSIESRVDAARALGREVPDLGPAPSIDRLVVAHGDPCAPNTLVRDGEFRAIVDVGRLGVADRWADLAVASMSLTWNGLGELEPEFWDAYGVQPDASRVAWYRRLWDAT